jgi:hypothetical protein
MTLEPRAKHMLAALAVGSLALMVDYFPWLGRIRYGTNSPRQRRNDGGNPSSNTK